MQHDMVVPLGPMPGSVSQYRPSITKEALVSAGFYNCRLRLQHLNVHPPFAGKRSSWRNGPGQYPLAVTMMGQRSSQTGIFLGDAGYLTRQRDETEAHSPQRNVERRGGQVESGEEVEQKI